MSELYVPDCGHVVRIDFDPQAGHEPHGHRPALVPSPASYNAKTSLALLCPITGNAKGYPFEVPVEGLQGVRGVVLADHVKSLDWRARRARFSAAVLPATLRAVRLKLAALLGL